MYLVFDIGGQSLKYAVYDKKLLVHYEQQLVYPHLIDLTQLLIYLNQIISQMVLKYKIIQIGIASPGIVDNKVGTINGLSAIKNYSNINLYQLLTKHNLPIQVENDAKCATLAELCLGQGKKYNNFIFLTIGTGIGGGIIINRKLYRGSHFMAGEIGCIIEEIFNKNNDYNINFSEKGSSYALEQYYKKLAPHKKLNGKEIFSEFENNSNAKITVDRMINTIAKNICNLNFILDPEIIFIGGAISKNEKFISLLSNEIELLTQKSGMPLLAKIKAATFQNDAGKMGALSLLLFNQTGELYA